MVSDNGLMLELLENLVNGILTLDKELLAELEKHQGKSLAVRFLNSRLVLSLEISDQGVHIRESDGTHSDVLISGTPADFMNFMISTRQSDGFRTGSLGIDGNVGLAQDVLEIMRRLDIDWEEYLSFWLGDNLAHQTGRLARSSVATVKNTGRAFTDNLSEYLIYESDYLVDANEIELFVESVDKLRNDVERLKVRMERFSQQEKQ